MFISVLVILVLHIYNILLYFSYNINILLVNV